MKQNFIVSLRFGVVQNNLLYQYMHKCPGVKHPPKSKTLTLLKKLLSPINSRSILKKTSLQQIPILLSDH